jgi:hypothetical protein
MQVLLADLYIIAEAKKKQKTNKEVLREKDEDGISLGKYSYPPAKDKSRDRQVKDKKNYVSHYASDAVVILIVSLRFIRAQTVQIG